MTRYQARFVCFQKKKWSFRSISFSKKDKTKPSREETPKNGDITKEEPLAEVSREITFVTIVGIAAESVLSNESRGIPRDSLVISFPRELANVSLEYS